MSYMWHSVELEPIVIADYRAVPLVAARYLKESSRYLKEFTVTVQDN